MERAPLKTLIVEDNPAKKRKLFERLNALPKMFADPDVVGSTSEALKRVQEAQFDLMILDVVVPLKPEGDADEQNAMDLLARLDAGGGGIKSPTHVLLISAANILSQSVREFVRGRPWGLIRYSEESEQALDDIERVAKWIYSYPQTNSRASICDVFIVTALEEPEFVAMEDAVEAEPLVPLDAVQLVRYFTVKSGGRDIKVGMGFAPRMGPVASAVLCTKVIENVRPKLLLMAGICGAIGTKADIGDVVAADSSWDWQSGKYVDDGKAGFHIAPHQLNVPGDVRSILIRLKREEVFWSSFAKDAIAVKAAIPKMILGPMATGASVIADERVTKKIRDEQNKNVVAVDMETYAVYAAAASATYKCGALSLKAVCDRADKEKNDAYRPYAAKVSAACALHLLQKFGEELLALYD
jgi:nucleoside phosphorylase